MKMALMEWIKKEEYLQIRLKFSFGVDSLKLAALNPGMDSRGVALVDSYSTTTTITTLQYRIYFYTITMW